MQTLDSWKTLTQQGCSVVALEAANIDRGFIFRFFEQQARELGVACYYWNLGYSAIQKVEVVSSDFQLSDTDWSVNEVLLFLLKYQYSGIFILDDLLNFDEIELNERRRREAQLQNLIDNLKIRSEKCLIVLLGSYLQFSEKLSAEIPLLKYPLPNENEVQEIVRSFSRERGLEWENRESLHRLGVACQGLPRGEIELSLKTYSALTQNINQLADLILHLMMAEFGLSICQKWGQCLKFFAFI